MRANKRSRSTKLDLEINNANAVLKEVKKKKKPQTPSVCPSWLDEGKHISQHGFSLRHLNAFLTPVKTHQKRRRRFLISTRAFFIFSVELGLLNDHSPYPPPPPFLFSSPAFMMEDEERATGDVTSLPVLPTRG